ncbi:MAG: hypothetical protein Q9169_007842, partial [Polycauliona sp. 2 TL-2023]
MRFISLLAAIFIYTVAAANVGSTKVENISATQLGVLQPQDIGIQRLYRGRPIPQQFTTYLLYYAQLVFYRRTVLSRGDAVLGRLDITLEDQANLRLEIRDLERAERGGSMTLGSSLYGIVSMLQTMLNPESSTDGFWELKWRIFHKVTSAGSRNNVPLGYVNLVLGGNRPFRNITSTDLAAPFPVPETDVILLIGPRGADLVQANAILIMSDLIGTAWRNLARDHSVQPVPGQVWNGRLRNGISVTLRPRMSRGSSMVTATDLAEAAFGLAYFFLTQQRAFETNVTVVRAIDKGRRVPIGELEI